MAKYNYKTITLVLDLDFEEDKKLLEWLETHKTKRNGLSEQLRKALQEYINTSKIDGVKK